MPAPRPADDGGYILVIVMVISAVVLALAALAIQTSTVNQAVTTSYSNTVQTRLASETGLNVTVAQIGAVLVTAPASNDLNGNMVNASGTALRSLLPCSLTSTSTPTYTSAVVYENASATPFAGCPATWSATTPAWPALAVVTSSGTYPHGSPLKLVEVLTVTAPTLTVTAGQSITLPGTTTLLPAFGAAIYSQGAVSLSGNVSATTTVSTTPANIIAGGGVTCPNNVIVQGSIYSYSTSAQGNFANSCAISGSLYSNAAISLSNSVSVGGDIWSYASGGITLSNSVRIGGNAVATNGSITTSSGTTVVGNANASGAINYNNGSAPWYGTVNGTVTPNNPALSTQTFPVQPVFPTLTDPTQASWQASEYINYVSVTAAGESINGGVVNPAMSCSTYFSAQYLAANNYQASASQFNVDLNNATVPTVIDAPTCSPNLSGPNATATYSLPVDVAVVLAGLQTSGTNTFTSSSSTTHNLSIIVPAPQTGTIALSNSHHLRRQPQHADVHPRDLHGGQRLGHARPGPGRLVDGRFQRVRPHLLGHPGRHHPRRLGGDPGPDHHHPGHVGGHGGLPLPHPAVRLPLIAPAGHRWGPAGAHRPERMAGAARPPHPDPTRLKLAPSSADAVSEIPAHTACVPSPPGAGAHRRVQPGEGTGSRPCEQCPERRSGPRATPPARSEVPARPSTSHAP